MFADIKDLMDFLFTLVKKTHSNVIQNSDYDTLLQGASIYATHIATGNKKLTLDYTGIFSGGSVMLRTSAARTLGLEAI